MKIDKNIPLPNPRNNYPFRGMDVGDSFFVANIPRQVVSGAAAYWGKTHNVVFALRATEEGGVKGVRCWRTA